MLAGADTSVPVALRGKFSANQPAVLTALVDQLPRGGDHAVRSTTAG
jgi:hypothetical protein